MAGAASTVAPDLSPFGGIWIGGFNKNASCEVDRLSWNSYVCVRFVICVISPCVMILFPLVLPGMMDIKTIQMTEFLIIALTAFATLAAGAGLIIGFAAQLRRLLRSPRHVTTVNRSLSSLLVVGGGWMAFS